MRFIEHLLASNGRLGCSRPWNSTRVGTSENKTGRLPREAVDEHDFLGPGAWADERVKRTMR
jgi:hypothetical protein